MVGLILTGKSIARFPELKERFAEYFLIGTLLEYWAGCSRRAGPGEALVRNHVFKVITIFYHSRVGKTTTEVALEFYSVVLEPTSEISTSVALQWGQTSHLQASKLRKNGVATW